MDSRRRLPLGFKDSGAINHACPHCGEAGVFSPAWKGTKVGCPKCKSVSVVGQSAISAKSIRLPWAPILGCFLLVGGLPVILLSPRLGIAIAVVGFLILMVDVMMRQRRR
jgi:hypothetical protein